MSGWSMPFTMPSIGIEAYSAVLSGYSQSNPFPSEEIRFELPEETSSDKMVVTGSVVFRQCFMSHALMTKSQYLHLHGLECSSFGQVFLNITFFVCVSKHHILISVTGISRLMLNTDSCQLPTQAQS